MFLLLNVLAQEGDGGASADRMSVCPAMLDVCSSGTTTALTPWPRHRAAFGRAFGCARVVFNDGLRARQEAHEAGRPYLTDAELSARLTAAKKTPERQWLGDVSAVVLQQALADPERGLPELFRLAQG
jgi:putative transposase